ncbi:hypothetical protein AAG570_006612 [Ranatra chinensis]|uniref:G-protein coupled receptors family 1 profile domain-containing protein n=1 Tax=Ranatra chinensis TaxID=642074 RepID=A0ABD0ZHS3_9HEMI
MYFNTECNVAGCQVYGFVGGMTGIASIFFLAAIALDRYNVISNPLDPVRKTTRLKAAIWAALIWTYSILFSSLPLTGHKFKPYVPEGYLTSCSFDYMTEDHFNKVFIFTFFLASWVVPFVVIVVCYCGICKSEKEKRKTELRLALVVVAVIVLWFVAWTPYAVVALLGITGRHGYITPLSSMIPAVFCKTASCIDPYVYSLSHPRLRKELTRIFCRQRYERERTNTMKTVWRTEASRSSIKGPDEVEEMTVAVKRMSKRQSFQDDESSASEGTVSVQLPVRHDPSPPSWYVPPKKDRSASFKHRSNDETPLTNISTDYVTA